jgi:hypothetical protein
MSTSLITGLAGYVQSIAGAALSKATGNATGAVNSAAALPAQTDNGQISPFAQLMSTLQQLQQSNPGQYQQVTQQIAANLQSAAQTATASGNTTAATQLTQLATDFTNSSKSGQLPSIQDLAQALGGAGHHHHGHHQRHAASADSSDGSTSSSQFSQALATFRSNGAQSGSFDPMSIIMDTL